MKSYLDLLKNVLLNGDKKQSRNALTYSMSGLTWQHDMSSGFPILTCRKLNIKNAITELRFFLQGRTNKKWLQERGNKFWDAFGITALGEIDPKSNWLGPIYGAQWRGFDGVTDQIANLLYSIEFTPNSRRMIVSAWNPNQLDKMSLPPCHYAFQVLINNNNMDLIWIQRSVDLCIGLPWDIMLYALLLELLADKFGYNPRYLIGQFGDAHIYEEHVSAAHKLLAREPRELPDLYIPYNLTWDDFIQNDKIINVITLNDYNPHPSIKFKLVP